MKLRNTGVALLVVFLCASAIRADTVTGLVFDDSNTAGFASHQVPGVAGADNGVGATITVSTATPITNFTLETYQPSGGDLKFFVYNETAASFGVITAAATFGSAYFDYVESPTFSYTLLPGNTYDIGAISDAETYYAYGYAYDGDGTVTVTQNGVTGPIRNILVQNYLSPTAKLTGSGSIATPGSAQFALQLYNNPATAAAPAPKTWLAGIALLSVVALRRLQRQVQLT